jgi:hypothetical protein
MCGRNIPGTPGGLLAGKRMINLHVDQHHLLNVAWRPCAHLSNVNNTTSRCDIIDPSTTFTADPGWTTLQFNIQNRTFTQLFSLLDSSINQIHDPGPAQPVAIDPQDIFTSLDILLWPFTQETSTVPNNSPNLQASVTIFFVGVTPNRNFFARSTRHTAQHPSTTTC